MDWATKYKKTKEQKALQYDKETDNKDLFNDYSQKVHALYDQFRQTVKDSGITVRTQKTRVSTEKKVTAISDSVDMDVLILADNENEIHLTPEGIGFIGVKGRVALKCYKKIYSFQSISERKIKMLREPYLVLIEGNDADYSWAYISPSEQSATRIMKPFDQQALEKILDEVFIT